MKKSRDNYESLIVEAFGKKMTLKECAEKYELDYSLLLSELIETGNIEESIMNVRAKQLYLDEVKFLISRLSKDYLDKLFYYIHVFNMMIERQQIDVLYYINNTAMDELTLSKEDLVAIICQNDINKPLIRGKEKEIIGKYMSFILDSEEKVLSISRSQAIELLNIVNDYKIPNEDFSLLINNYLIESFNQIESAKNYVVKIKK